MNARLMLHAVSVVEWRSGMWPDGGPGRHLRGAAEVLGITTDVPGRAPVGQPTPAYGARHHVLIVGRPAGFDASRDRGLIQVNVERAHVPLSDAAIARISDRRFAAGPPALEAVLGPLLVGMAGRLTEIQRAATEDPQSARLLASALVSAVALLARCLAAERTGCDDATRERRSAVTGFIDSHLGDPALNPDTVARALLMSRRSLYHLLSEGSAPATLIRTRRLLRARQMLADPGESCRSTAEIARAVGFRSSAHFSRVFRAEFGLTPREVRRDTIGTTSV